MSKFILLVDLGNSFAKLALLPITQSLSDVFYASANGNDELRIADKVDSFQDSKLIKLSPTANEIFNQQTIERWLNDISVNASDLDYVWVSSVRTKETNKAIHEWMRALMSEARIAFLQSERQCHNLINGYENNQALGVDRWMVAIAANALLQSNHQLMINLKQSKVACLVVDAGSALTIEFIEVKSEPDDSIYQGGLIIPGMKKMFESLAKTDNLPLMSTLESSVEKERVEYCGKNTQQAIQLGVESAMIGAVNCAIDRLKQSGFVNVFVYLTGGDNVIFNQEIQQVHVETKEDLIFLGLFLAGIDTLAGLDDIV